MDVKRLLLIILFFCSPSWALYKNVTSQKVPIYPWNISSSTEVTGDAANITATISIDGAASSPLTDTNPVERDRGVYFFDVTQAETNGNLITIYASSTTSGCYIQPVSIYTMTVERGTDSAVLASSYTAPSNATVELIYTEVAGLNGEAMRGTDSAVTDISSLATEATQYLVWQEVNGLNGAAMRGTDSASTHSAADVWAVATRILTALDEDSTTIDLNGSTVGIVTTVTNAVSVTGTVDADIESVNEVAVTNINDFKATGFSTHSAADVWTSGTRTLTALDEDSTTIDLDSTTVSAPASELSATTEAQIDDIDADVEEIKLSIQGGVH